MDHTQSIADMAASREANTAAAAAATVRGPNSAVAEAPEQWHTEVPPVPGVYWSRLEHQTEARNHSMRWYDGVLWHHGIQPRVAKDARLCSAYRDNKGVEWSHLIEADAPVRPPLLWLRGDQVPEGERVGLWFCDASGGRQNLHACPAGKWIFDGTFTSRFLRAAPGVKDGDAFDPSLYAEVK